MLYCIVRINTTPTTRPPTKLFLPSITAFLVTASAGASVVATVASNAVREPYGLKVLEACE
jgi:hypothetical protein